MKFTTKAEFDCPYCEQSHVLRWDHAIAADGDPVKCRKCGSEFWLEVVDVDVLLVTHKIKPKECDDAGTEPKG